MTSSSRPLCSQLIENGKTDVVEREGGEDEEKTVYKLDVKTGTFKQLLRLGANKLSREAGRRFDWQNQNFRHRTRRSAQVTQELVVHLASQTAVAAATAESGRKMKRRLMKCSSSPTSIRVIYFGCEMIREELGLSPMRYSI